MGLMAIIIKSPTSLISNTYNSKYRRKVKLLISYKISKHSSQLLHMYKLPDGSKVWSDPWTHELIYYHTHSYIRSFKSPSGYKPSGKITPHRHQEM